MPEAAEASLVIDARPRGPAGPLAGETVLGRPVLARLVEAAHAAGARRVTIHARDDERDALARLVAEDNGVACRFAPGPPPAGAFVLRADRLYEPARLRRARSRGRDPETAVLWRLDTPQGLAVAGEELVRRQTYQPLGRFWALGPARALAHRLCPTSIRPNAVTIAAAALFLGSAGVIATGVGGLAARLGVAAALALALVLDTADGHLARLQGTATPFGRWLDGFLDELGDVSLHAAIAWSLSEAGSRPGWLALGMLYPAGKYLFAFGSMTWSEDGPRGGTGAEETAGGRWGRSLVRMAGHADIRWHLWIVLAAAGRLDIELVAYSLYYPLRAAAGAWRKAVGRG